MSALLTIFFQFQNKIYQSNSFLKPQNLFTIPLSLFFQPPSNFIFLAFSPQSLSLYFLLSLFPLPFIILFFFRMSRRRNRHRSLSTSSRNSDRPIPNTSKFANMRSTTNSLYMPRESYNDEVNCQLQRQDHLYNKNIAKFRGNFNQNDTSQLPFMSSLRQSHTLTPRKPHTMTISSPFIASLKSTANQRTKKQISDFSSKQTRLSPAYYRWHRGSGKGNKWAVQFQCGLRDYGDTKNNEEKEYYSYIKPIVYKDVQPLLYRKEDMVCSGRRHLRAFNIAQ